MPAPSATLLPSTALYLSEVIPPLDLATAIGTESDGPYVAHGARASAPADVPTLVRDLAGAWSCDPDEARQRVWDNMSAVYGGAKRHGAHDLTDPQARLTV